MSSVPELNYQSNAAGGPPPPRLRFETAAPQGRSRPGGDHRRCRQGRRRPHPLVTL